MTVWIIEKFNGVLRAAPLYVHTNITNSAVFNISGALLGTYMSRQVGTTIDDTGTNCAFGGSHVHEDHANVNGAVVGQLASTYPSAGGCHTSCGRFRNDSPANWTRKFSWPEGG